MNELTVGSLFSGAGLGDLGLEWAGFEHKWFCEIDEYAQKVLRHRFDDCDVYDDVRDVSSSNVEHVDILIGGFPCQDISYNGLGRGIMPETRSGLWYEYARIISEIRPEYAIVENVAALLARGIDVVLRDLAQIGYDAEWQVLSSSSFGGLHLRERVFIVAYPAGERWDEATVFPRCPHEHQRISREYRCSSDQTTRWISKAGTSRDFDGSTDWMDRLRCCGNGIDPYCTYFIGRLIQEHHKRCACRN